MERISNGFFATLYTALALILIYWRYVYIVAKLTTLHRTGQLHVHCVLLNILHIQKCFKHFNTLPGTAFCITYQPSAQGVNFFFKEEKLNFNFT